MPHFTAFPVKNSRFKSNLFSSAAWVALQFSCKRTSEICGKYVRDFLRWFIYLKILGKCARWSIGYLISWRKTLCPAGVVASELFLSPIKNWSCGKAPSCSPANPLCAGKTGSDQLNRPERTCSVQLVTWLPIMTKACVLVEFLVLSENYIFPIYLSYLPD